MAPPLVLGYVSVREQKQARAHLTRIEESMREKGIAVTHKVMHGVDAATEILAQEKMSRVDLVLMASRGRSTVARWAFR
jgi:nucleotide-binding universal stress UspA family protein